MLYPLLKFGHIVGLMLIGAGLIGVFLADIRTRQAHTLPVFAEAVRGIALFYDGLVVPGALLLAGSGAWLIAAFHGWAGLLETPWLAGMVLLFAFEFVEGNTVTRLYFLRLRRATAAALRQGRFTEELDAVRSRPLPTFTHFLDLPLLMVIVSLGVLRPDGWLHFAVGSTVAVILAIALTLTLLRWKPGQD
ncbi:MAG TPA: DUF2269 family protein [Azospirillum sp.]|nr:DUF2269 family protein [Azospirillum sp.]